MKNAILSIKPTYCRSILSGEKRYEFRKRVFKNPREVELVFIYSTSPIRKIVGAFRITEIIEDSPDAIWRRCRHAAGIERKDFFRYFSGVRCGFAVSIQNPIALDPIDPWNHLPEFNPPQSFAYTNSTFGLRQEMLPLEAISLSNSRNGFRAPSP